nr:amidohydrolase family protein [Pleomorphovibrio marinus]
MAASERPPKGSIVIRNGNLLTITNGLLEATDLWIEDGVIKKIGKELKVPSGISSIDATGKYVMPGIIDAHSHIALETVNEASSPITSEVWMGDVVDPFDISIYRALAGGVTVSHAMHGSANAIGGQNITLKHRYGNKEPSGLFMNEAPRTIKFALGENPTRVHGRGKNIQPKSRMGVEAVIRNGFEEAKQYTKRWEEYEKNKGKEVPPSYNLRLETLRDVLDGKIIIHCHSYRADEIYMLIQVCKEYGIDKIVFSHVNEGFKVAPELAKYSMGASVFSDWWAYKFEVYYSTAYNAAILTRNGVLTSVNSDSGEVIRHLYHEAGKSQKYGDLSDEEALSLITINPAIQLGIDQWVGSLEEGKHGDIAIFDRHPLSIYAIPEMTFIEGVKYFDRHEDETDQRLKVDPREKVEAVYLYQETHNCMRDVDFFFTNFGRNLFEHKH